MFALNRHTGPVVLACTVLELACSGEQSVQDTRLESPSLAPSASSTVNTSAETEASPPPSTSPPDPAVPDEEQTELNATPNASETPPMPPDTPPQPSGPAHKAGGSPNAGGSGGTPTAGAGGSGGTPTAGAGGSGGTPTAGAGGAAMEAPIRDERGDAGGAATPVADPEETPPLDGYDAPCPRSQSEASKQVVREGMTAVMIRGGASVDEIKQYWGGPNGEYIQHNPIAPNGVDTFAGFFAGGGGNYTLSHLIGECDLVVTYGSYGGRATFDMLRVDATVGRMVEHWDAAGGALGGESEVRDLELTGVHRQLIQDFIQDVLIDGKAARASTYLSPSLTEHNSDITADGTSYTRIHHQISEGNFVFTLSEGEAGNASRGFHDLFRIEGGLIVEHWGANLRAQAGASGEGIF